MGDRQRRRRGEVIGQGIGKARAVARHRLRGQVNCRGLAIAIGLLGSPAQPAKARGGRVHGVLREVQLGPIVRGQRQVPEDERLEALLRQIRDADDVARALGHLRVAKGQELAVHPGAHHPVADGALRLRDLVLVVGKLVVDPAGVDVDVLAQVLEAHRRALDVPPGKAWAPG